MFHPVARAMSQVYKGTYPPQKGRGMCSAGVGPDQVSGAAVLSHPMLLVSTQGLWHAPTACTIPALAGLALAADTHRLGVLQPAGARHHDPADSCLARLQALLAPLCCVSGAAQYPGPAGLLRRRCVGLCGMRAGRRRAKVKSARLLDGTHGAAPHRSGGPQPPPPSCRNACAVCCPPAPAASAGSRGHAAGGPPARRAAWAACRCG